MILVDYSNVSFAAILVGLAKGDSDSETGVIMSPGFLLGKLRIYNTKFRNEFGELVICNDGAGSWRKKYFPLYKCRRQPKPGEDGAPAEPDENFARLIEIKSDVYEALDRHSPFRCIKIRGAEGDDVMAALSRLPGKHVIISADKDMTQLNSPNVKCWNPIKRTFVDNGKNFNRFLTMAGDAGDDVPNFLSDDDVFDNPDKRQRPLRKIVRDTIMDSIDPILEIPDLKVKDIGPEELLRNWERNSKLVDLGRMPKVVREACINRFEEIGDNKKFDLFNLFSTLQSGNYVNRSSEFIPNKD